MTDEIFLLYDILTDSIERSITFHGYCTDQDEATGWVLRETCAHPTVAESETDDRFWRSIRVGTYQYRTYGWRRLSKMEERIV